MRYYFDSCIWRDHYENRFGFKGRPLGNYASKLFMKIMKNKDILLFSDLLIKELKIQYNEKDINDMLNILFLMKILEFVNIDKSEFREAETIAKKRNLPLPDVLHAIISRDNKAILVSQDKHFQKLKDLVEIRKPEEII